MNEFKQGDVVQLRSGGLKMTVKQVRKKSDDVLVECVWTEYGEMFDGNHQQIQRERAFPQGVLKKI